MKDFDSQLKGAIVEKHGEKSCKGRCTWKKAEVGEVGREADTIGYDRPYLFQLKQTDVLRVY